jgi:hypothetical protein
MTNVKLVDDDVIINHPESFIFIFNYIQHLINIRIDF